MGLQVYSDKEHVSVSSVGFTVQVPIHCVVQIGARWVGVHWLAEGHVDTCSDKRGKVTVNNDLRNQLCVSRNVQRDFHENTSPCKSIFAGYYGIMLVSGKSAW